MITTRDDDTALSTVVVADAAMTAAGNRTSVTRTGTSPAGALAATPVAAMWRFCGSRAVRHTKRTTASLISDFASPKPPALGTKGRRFGPTLGSWCVT